MAERTERLTIGDGWRFAIGISWYFLLFVCVGWVISLIDGTNHDSTDGPGQHSGVELHTDHLTGCQYVATAGGGIYPRLDQTGKPMCEGDR